MYSFNGSAILSPIFIRGSSDESGFWNIICIFGLSFLKSFFLSSRMFVFLKNILPSVGSMSRRSNLPTVVFPHPLSPTKPRVSPFSIAKLIPSTALMYFLPNIPVEKYFFKFSTLIIQETPHKMVFTYLYHFWSHTLAPLSCKRASWMEFTAFWEIY